MEDRLLAKISLVLAIVGVVALFFVVESIKPRGVRIGEIGYSMVGETIIVNASVKDISSRGGHVFLKLFDGNQIGAVMFERDARRQPEVYNLSENDFITVVGEVNDYRGDLEIVVKSFKRLWQ